jgi:hypothetical protein
LLGAVDAEDGDITTDSGVVLGPPGAAGLDDGDADEDVDVYSAAGVVIGVSPKKPATCGKSYGGSKTPLKSTVQVVHALSKRVMAPGKES